MNINPGGLGNKMRNAYRDELWRESRWHLGTSMQVEENTIINPLGIARAPHRRGNPLKIDTLESEIRTRLYIYSKLGKKR